MSQEEMLRVLGKKYSVDILRSTGTPKSAKELSSELDIPVATSYRRVEELVDHGLLEECSAGVPSKNGSEATVYRRAIDGIRTRFDGTVTVELTRRSRWEQLLDSAWSNLPGN